jgi:hypothetical protein
MWLEGMKESREMKHLVETFTRLMEITSHSDDEM